VTDLPDDATARARRRGGAAPEPEFGEPTEDATLVSDRPRVERLPEPPPLAPAPPAPETVAPAYPARRAEEPVRLTHEAPHRPAQEPVDVQALNRDRVRRARRTAAIAVALASVVFVAMATALVLLLVSG
jgi:hypothetical protein